jgi:RNA polymerase sigma factor (sigma-70 family)
MSAIVPRTATTTDTSVQQLYERFSRRLERIVSTDVRAPDTVVEDACQFAWGSLLVHATRVRAEAALSWLATTAVREAWRLMRTRERDVSLEADDAAVTGGAEPWSAVMTDAIVEDREQLRLIRQLPERQQRILWLHGLGLSYEEIAAYTGDTPRTVERQLLRGRSRVRELAV